ncbi:ATP-binding protein [Undibacterium sp. Dicai25W]|uniref:ATP-binding protein n=1 Tax=Undibacterium sp. Dicai25W TaxID=3413034 RepID=UPI003BF3B904
MSETDLVTAPNTDEEEKNIAADTRPTKKLLIEGITRDLTVEACIFDLIDNSIDAKKENDSGLIEIKFDGSTFSIQDYASGIGINEMSESTLRFGAVTSHVDGIGAFGVGLNRALFKLGKDVSITSETTDERIEVNWNVVEYMNNDIWDIPISVKSKQGLQGTLVQVHALTDDVALAFSDSKWKGSLIAQLSKRYGCLIKNKGCIITLNGAQIPALVPSIKESVHFKPLETQFVKDGVSVEIKLGRHHLHLFTGEDPGTENAIKIPTEDYGWTVYCNDRAILINEMTHKVGWDTERHSQHYGFVGIVHLRGEPRLLPWSTSKEDVDLHNAVYVDALKHMRDYSSKWRSFTDKVKKGKINFQISTDPERQGSSQLSLLPSANSSNEAAISGDAATQATLNGNQNASTTHGVAAQANQGVAPSTDKYNVQEHPNQWNYLFGPNITSRVQFKIPSTSPKLVAIVNELQKLEIKNFACSTMLLLRVFIEESCKYYSSRHPGVTQLEHKGSLAKTVKSIVHYMEQNNILTDGNEIAAIKSICSPRGEEVISIEYLQNSIHSKSNFLSGELIRPFWRDIHPFIKACYK